MSDSISYKCKPPKCLYSKIKNDPNICPELLAELYGMDIDTIAYYERPWNKQLRQLYAGQGIEWDKISAKRILQAQMPGAMWSSRRIQTNNQDESRWLLWWWDG